MNRLVIAPSILAADFGRLAEERVGRNRFIAPVLPRAGRPPSTEACLGKRRNKAIAPYGPHPDVS
jgi:hypothetical protein